MKMRKNLWYERGADGFDSLEARIVLILGCQVAHLGVGEVDVEDGLEGHLGLWLGVAAEDLVPEDKVDLLVCILRETDHGCDSDGKELRGKVVGESADWPGERR